MAFYPFYVHMYVCMYVRSKSFERAVAYPVKVNMRTSLTFLLHTLALKFKAGSMRFTWARTFKQS